MRKTRPNYKIGISVGVLQDVCIYADAYYRRSDITRSHGSVRVLQGRPAKSMGNAEI